MAKEAPENEENAENEEVVEHPMFSKKGKLVFIVVAALQFAAFAAFFFLATKPDKQPEVLQEKIAEKNVRDLNGPRIEVTQPIIVSIPTNELATEFRHLAVTLTIIVGRVEGEEDPNIDLMGKLTEEQFLETAETFEPWVKDRVNKIAMSYSYLQLQQETTKAEFTKRLKKELNNILQEYGLKPRFKEILLTSFIFSD
jgi:flagellar basal body-associated protein FliL